MAEEKTIFNKVLTSSDVGRNFQPPRNMSEAMQRRRNRDVLRVFDGERTWPFQLGTRQPVVPTKNGKQIGESYRRVFFKRATWADFMKKHQLEEGDKLVFKMGKLRDPNCRVCRVRRECNIYRLLGLFRPSRMLYRCPHHRPKLFRHCSFSIKPHQCKPASSAALSLHPPPSTPQKVLVKIVKKT